MRLLLIGNSDGIGWALTRRLLDRGDHVVGISRSPLPEPGYAPERCEHHVMDVTDESYPETLTTLCDRHEFDACIYLAGIGLGFDPGHLENDRHVIDVNFNAAVRTVETCLTGMLARGRGHVLALSSIADQLILDDAPSYCTSKVALSRYLASVGLALRDSGVAITNVRFGFVDTKMAHAPIKPRMIGAEKAATLIERCLERRPLQFTYPKSMAALAGLLRVVGSLRVWWRRSPRRT